MNMNNQAPSHPSRTLPESIFLSRHNAKFGQQQPQTYQIHPPPKPYPEHNHPMQDNQYRPQIPRPPSYTNQHYQPRLFLHQQPPGQPKRRHSISIWDQPKIDPILVAKVEHEQWINEVKRTGRMTEQQLLLQQQRERRLANQPVIISYQERAKCEEKRQKALQFEIDSAIAQGRVQLLKYLQWEDHQQRKNVVTQKISLHQELRPQYHTQQHHPTIVPTYPCTRYIQPHPDDMVSMRASPSQQIMRKLYMAPPIPRIHTNNNLFSSSNQEINIISHNPR